MKFILTTLAVALPLMATDAGAASLRMIDIPADAEGPALTGAAWYPCTGVPTEVKAGPVTLPAVKDCPVTGAGMPLVVISHGVGGWWGGHHDVAETLADAGFVVAAINHPLDSGMAQ